MRKLGERRIDAKALEVAGLFLRLGLTAFGGPAAHIAVMHDEIVKRRHWLTNEEFLDLMGVTNLIPGPNSTEMAIHLGYRQAGWAGLVLGGAAFIFPAMAIVLALAWAYVRFGSLPQVDWLLYGIKPVMVTIILQALWELGRKALKDRLTWGAALVVAALSLAGADPILLLFAAGLVVLSLRSLQPLPPAAAALALGFSRAAFAAFETRFSLPVLFLTFLKIGSVLYGSGYVLLAFLHTDFVQRLGWLTNQQLLDAVAIGQVTPGPVFTTATFIGYLLAGLPGGLLATLGIFLPSFLFVALSSSLIPRIRASSWARSLLDGVNAASLGLMAAVLWPLGRTSIVDGVTLAILIASGVLLMRFRVNATWLIAGGALIGIIYRFLS